MISLRDQLMEVNEVNAVRQWLRQPACRTLLEHLANRAASLTAEAGNLLVAGDAEAPLKAESARTLMAMLKLLEEMRAPEYYFGTVKLEPQTVISPTNYASRTKDRTETFPGSSIAPASAPLA